MTEEMFEGYVAWYMDAGDEDEVKVCLDHLSKNHGEDEVRRVVEEAEARWDEEYAEDEE